MFVNLSKLIKVTGLISSRESLKDIYDECFDPFDYKEAIKPYLIWILKDHDAENRLNAVKFLSTYRDDQFVVKQLTEHLEFEFNVIVIAQIDLALAYIRGEKNDNE